MCLANLRNASMKLCAIAFLVLALPAPAFAQTNPASQVARQWRQQHERSILDEFIAFLRIPDVASERADIQRNADLIVKMMEARGVSARQVSIAGANPVVFGEIRTA